MRKLHLYVTTMLFIFFLGQNAVTQFGFTSYTPRTATLPLLAPEVSREKAAIAHIYVEDSLLKDLVVDLGVGDTVTPMWTITVWNKGGGEVANLNLTIDISEALSFLPPSVDNEWFLKVFDVGNRGQIQQFAIVYDGQTYDSTCVPVAIRDSQASFSYIPSIPLELAMSRRISIRDFPETENYSIPEVSSECLSKILWAGYGSSSWGRTVANITGQYPLVIYVCNKTAVYRYNPAEQNLDLWKYGDYRFSDQFWVYPGPGTHPAPIELFIALDTNRYSDVYLGAMEAGAIIQNIYLEANALGLGTVCVGGVNATLVHEFLNLPANEIILYNMPLGHPTPSAFYNFTCAAPPGSVNWDSLPPVKQSSVFLNSALMEVRTSHEWGETPLTSQETSQVLWSAYGISYLYDMRPSPWSPYRHKIVASAGGTYPLTIWMLNSTGVYLYDHWLQTLTIKSIGDKRGAISEATNAYWMVSAPMILVAVLNSSRMDQGRLDWVYTEVGCATQNVRLESAAWGLVADSSSIVDEEAVKTVLGLVQQTDLHPITVMAVGHPSLQGDVNEDGTVDIFDAIMLSAAWNSVPGSPQWNPKADINNDNIVDIFDAIILSKDFGKKA